MDFNEYVSRGAAFFQEGKIGAVIENFETVLKLDPDDDTAREFLEMAKSATA